METTKKYQRGNKYKEKMHHDDHLKVISEMLQ